MKGCPARCPFAPATMVSLLSLCTSGLRKWATAPLRAFQAERQEIACPRVPGLVTERTEITGNRQGRHSPHGRNQDRTASPPRHQNAFSHSPSKKRSRVAAWPDCFQFSTRAPSFPRAPFRIANRPALNQAAHPRHPIPLTKNLRITQYSGRPDGKSADAPYFPRRDGGWYWRETLRHGTARLRLSR